MITSTTAKTLEAVAIALPSRWAQEIIVNSIQTSWTSKPTFCPNSEFQIQKEAKKDKVGISK
tara:strand:- start:389 stop:574 length:186 start_codon:yes stop_codon:yes gene_type:complete